MRNRQALFSTINLHTDQSSLGEKQALQLYSAALARSVWLWPVSDEMLCDHEFRHVQPPIAVDVGEVPDSREVHVRESGPGGRESRRHIRSMAQD